jgi:hypothetical protein
MPGKIWNGKWFPDFVFSQKILGQKSGRASSPRFFAEMRRISAILPP